MRKARQRRGGISLGQTVFLIGLVGMGLVLTSRAFLRGERRESAPPDLAQQVKDYLRAKEVAPLSGELDELLANSAATSLPTLPHPLLGTPAPSFRLSDHQGAARELSEFLADGPLVVVFYYGYSCNHCVGQLFAVHDDIAKFRELGAQVVAISADPPEQTTARFAKFGPFDFPVLSDVENQVAAQYSVYLPANQGSPSRLLHGTFVLDQQGLVRWCHYGDEPFTDNATLLVELAKVTGRISP